MSISINGNGITSANIADGAITNADIADDAITDAKLASGGGKVLQVVFAEDITQTNVATTTYTDTGLSATITPASTSSTILVMWDTHISVNSTGKGLAIKLLRDATTVYTSALAYDLYPNNAGARMRASWKHLDSPATTSAITYKTQASSYLSDSITLGENGNQTQMVLMEIGV